MTSTEPPAAGSLGRVARDQDKGQPEKPPRKKVSGPSGRNTQAGVLIREVEPGQLDSWRAAAERAGMGLTAWVRKMLDAAARKR